MKGIKLYRDERLSTSRRRQLDRTFFAVLAVVSFGAIGAACALLLLTR